MKTLTTIEASRGVAATLVLLLHATTRITDSNYFDFTAFGGVFLFGYSGVDFFFVLSGFIIFSVHRNDVGKKNKVVDFAKKRFIRVYPIYWVICAFVIPVYFIFPSFGFGYERNLEAIIKSLILFPFPSPQVPIVPVAWTLTYEIIFYSLFALLIIHKTLGKSVMLFWQTLVVLNIIFKFIGPDDNLLLYVIFRPINIEFLFGMIISYIALNKNIKYSGYILTTGTLLFLFFGICISFKLFNINSYATWMIFGIPSSLIVLGCASGEIKGSFKAPRWAVFVGGASYTIYLVHWHALGLIAKAVKLSGLGNFLHGNFIFILISILAMACGLLVHYFIDKPLLTFLRKAANLRTRSNTQ